MLFVNLVAMFNKGFDVEYEAHGHRWINKKINDDYIIAVCANIKPSVADYNYIAKRLEIIKSLKEIIAKANSSPDENVRNRIPEFQVEVDKISKEINTLRYKLIAEHEFPHATKLDPEYFFIEIKENNKFVSKGGLINYDRENGDDVDDSSIEGE